MGARSMISDYEVCLAYEWYRHAVELWDRRLATTPKFATERLQEKFGCDWKVVDAAVLRAFKHDLIDYGVSMRSGWLTEKGKELLAKGGGW